MVLLDLVLCNKPAILAGTAGINGISGKVSNCMTDTPARHTAEEGRIGVGKVI